MANYLRFRDKELDCDYNQIKLDLTAGWLGLLTEVRQEMRKYGRSLDKT